MKKVFSSNDECIHTFAQREQQEGRTSSRNVFFEGDRLYSYGRHYLLAEFINDGDAIFINDKGYSVSTSKHIGITIGATRQYKQFFKTQTDIYLVRDKILELKDKLARARKPIQYVTQITELYEKYMEWRTYSNIKGLSDEYKEIRKIYKALNKPEYLDLIKAEAKKQEERKKELAKKKLAEVLPKFMNHEVRSFRVGNEDYLRLSKDKTKVETSQGISVPVKDAKVLFNMIQNKVDIVGHRIDGYTVTSLNGTLTIGCHKINRDSVNEIGLQL